MSVIKGKIIVGTATKMYVNGVCRPYTNKVSWKVTKDYDDKSFMGEYGTYPIYLGYNVEGTIEESKTDSYYEKIVLESAESGIDPDITIIVNLNNPRTNASEVVKLTGVVFTEAGSEPETKQLVNVSIPFKAEKAELIDSI
jgi:hypothetical protein